MTKKKSLLSYIGLTKQAGILKEVTFNDKISKVHLSGFIGSSFATIASGLLIEDNNPHLFVLRDKKEASQFLNDLNNLIDKQNFFFPESNRNSYRLEETNNSDILLRSEILNVLSNKKNQIIITYSEAICERVIEKKTLEKNIIVIKKNDQLCINNLESKLTAHNFKKVDFVSQIGEYSVRGGIVDVYSFSNKQPIRIEFFDDEVESIRTFDINNQLSTLQKEQIKLIPNTQFYDKNITNKINFLEYIPKNTIVWISDINYTISIVDDYFKKAAEELKYKRSYSAKQIKNPKDIFTDKNEFIHSLNKFTVIENNSHPYFEDSKKISLNASHITHVNKQFELLKNDLDNNQKNGFKNIILCSSDEQKDRFDAIFKNQNKFKYTTLISSLSRGYIDQDNRIAIYTDHQIFNRHYRMQSKTSFSDKKAISIKDITKLNIGDFVTHIDHGIGRFEGLHKISTNNKKQEVIKILYKDGDILYVSIHSLHKISKFSAKEGMTPKINQLGSQVWKKIKQRTKTKVKQIAFDLIKLYAKRKLKKGFAFSKDTYLQYELESSFMFEDTPDQVQTTNDFKKDMESNTPMDRLVCGDVGFGKTEIAVRAAFKAITDSKQVAILVPTTILALQHYKTFKKRLKDFPCNIEYISRFKSSKEQKNTLKDLFNGKVDILIGTHKIVSKDVKFNDLGLLIIDEEQKFGVNIKDKIKLIKENIDTLTLSATPIPRTLQFSLLGARDLSIINTPPPNRQSIETNIIRMNHDNIKNAILYEIDRTGQVYFVHNRIDNINEVATLIQKLVPKSKIRIGHGRMNGNELEQLMVDFIEGDFDILVSTTIIENGVDVPNANTIIINNAHNFGLSDLHQMRGRVGRSNKKAFCYLISPPIENISEESRKRLHALEQYSELGSGFKIAMRDLDIRGAGDLLGADQSGFINDIGFETYQKILNEAIEELKSEKFSELFPKVKSNIFIKDCQLDTDLEVVIPDSYVSSVSERLYLYNKLNSLKQENDIIVFQESIKDRFGKIPKEVINLCNSVKLRWIGKEIGFEKIILKENNFRGYFPSKNNVEYFNSSNFKKIINYITENQDNCKIIEKNQKLSLKVLNINSIMNAINFCNKIKCS